jgi:hypothetical protein
MGALVRTSASGYWWCFIWRIYCVSQYEERDGGVYLEIEAIVPSRGIPSSVRCESGGEPSVGGLDVKNSSADT